MFGLLALQNGLIDQAKLLAAFQAWTLDKSRSLANHLVALGHLSVPHRAAVEAMAELHVELHGGAVERSLAAIPAGRSIRESLARLGDPGVDASVARIASGSTEQDVDRTFSYTVGTATSDGQRFRVLRPHAKGGLGAVFVALDTELTARSPSSRSSTTMPTMPPAAPGSCSRPRSPAGWNIRGSSRCTAWGPIRTAGPITRCGSSGATASRRPSLRSIADPSMDSDRGRRSLALRKLLRTFLDVCNAIDYAHSRGVLHRDLKPSNIIVGKHGETLVVDWGLAKALGRTEPGVASAERLLVPSLSSGSAETLPGSALGTPAYMSPEQAVGDLEHLGPRSDVYSLGATLYCLLTGKPPFENDDVGTVLRAVQKGHFAPPRAIDPTIDPALEAVCLKAMALKPEERYPTPRRWPRTSSAGRPTSQ